MQIQTVIFFFLSFTSFSVFIHNMHAHTHNSITQLQMALKHPQPTQPRSSAICSVNCSIQQPQACQRSKKKSVLIYYYRMSLVFIVNIPTFNRTPNLPTFSSTLATFFIHFCSFFFCGKFIYVLRKNEK